MLMNVLIIGEIFSSEDFFFLGQRVRMLMTANNPKLLQHIFLKIEER